jgi:hypothetical protein
MRSLVVIALSSIVVVGGVSLWLVPRGDSPGSIDLPSTGVTPDVQPPDTSPSPPPRGGTGFGRGGPPARPAPAPGTLPSPVPIADRFTEIDEALGQLVTGRVAFNSPERMQFSETRTVALVASPELDASTLSSELRQRVGNADPIEIETLQIAPVMEAQLEGGAAFAIVALTPARQPVSRASPTEWRWSVRAEETGTHALHLSINAIVTVAGESYPRSLDVLDRTIDVDITSSQRIGMFIEGNWQWLLGTIAIPLGVWLWTQRTKGKGRRRRR